MKIKRIINQVRRDFIAIYECEHCEFEQERRGSTPTFTRT